MNKNDLRFLKKDKPNYTNEDIELLKSGYPLAYIIGYVDFLDCKINLNHKVLIPRPETEYWVSKFIPELPNKNFCILDIFCGSGCIGISILKANPNVHVTFSDIDESAISQTQENLKLNAIDESRYRIIKSDLFENLSEKFDYIFANPPYVGINDEVGEEIKHEPQNAIYANNDGLEIIEKFLNLAKNYLDENGTIYMEIGSNQKEKIAELINNKYSANFLKDQYEAIRLAKLNPITF